MLRIAGHRGTRQHAPENSYQALVCSFTAGGDVLELDLQLTADGRLVLSHDGTVERLTGDNGNISELTLDELRNTANKFDFSKTFNPHDVEGFSYYPKHHQLRIEVFDEVIDRLPADIELLIELKHDSTQGRDEKFRELFVSSVMHELEVRGLIDKSVLYSQDPKTLVMIRKKSSQVRIALFRRNTSDNELLSDLFKLQADGIVTRLSNIYEDGVLTEFAKKFEEIYRARKLRVGLIAYPSRSPGIFTPREFKALEQLSCVWSLSTDSIQSVLNNPDISNNNSALQRFWSWIESDFSGTTVDESRWALGYAKSNKWCKVSQTNGVHIETLDYDGWLPPDETGDEIKDTLNDLRNRMHFAEQTWPYYSGGGLGLILPINGDFIAEVDYSIRDAMTQAQTLELAVVNVDPGRHQGTPPQSKRDTDTFYDPHGCPPYVGIEHDEDDGYRINWNLGSEYESNQYGSPVGNGAKALGGTLRLERRGEFFSGHYKNEFDAPDWICVGAIRNLSLNESVFLRCVAKRWRQYNSSSGEYHQIQSNKFTFSKVRIYRQLRRIE